MNWFKLALAVTGMVIASSAAQAGTITTDRVSFNAGNTFLNASGGPASVTISPATKPNTVVDGKVQIDATSLRYWWATRPGWTPAEARESAAKAWTFTLSHAGQTVDLGGLPGPVKNHWFKTTAFDGVTTGGDWVLTANSDYNPARKRMIQFNLAGFFDVKAGPSDVPVPATALFVLVGLAGIGAASRRKAKTA